MENSGVKYVLGAMARLLRPLVRLLILRGVSYDQAADILRKTYCDVAFGEEFALPGRKQTDSRVSVITGLTRKDVARLKEMTLESPGLMANHNRATRVMTGWWLDHPSTDSASGAAPLRIEGESDSFAAVVRKYSGDMPMRAVLDELVRVGAVRVRGDEVELFKLLYSPDSNEQNKIEYLGTDVADLIATISHNLSSAPENSLLQQRIFLDNVPVEHVESVHQTIRELAMPVLNEAKRRVAHFDRDVNPDLGGTGRKRVTFGVYFSEDDFPESAQPVQIPNLPPKAVTSKKAKK
jgi:Family of unknown function (DUF6502)